MLTTIVSVIVLALALVVYPKVGLLDRIKIAPISTTGYLISQIIVPIMLFGTLLVIFNGATLKIAKLMPDFYNSETLIRVLHLGKCIRSGCLEKYAYSAGNHCGRRNCRSWVVQQN